MISNILDSEGVSYLAPEVVQTSAMDCGPAALKCLLEGFGISASYGRLREACQTDVDGTSIDTIEEVANQLGLEAEQVMVPVDHLLLQENDVLPALVVVRLPNGFTHFVVVWRRDGPFIQVMDPSVGRRFISEAQLREQLYIHKQLVPSEAWRAWAGGEGFCEPLAQRMATLEVTEEKRAELLATAQADPTWRSLGALDAAVRMVDTIVRAKGLEAGQEAEEVLERFFRRAQMPDESGNGMMIPQTYWSIFPPPSETNVPEGYLIFRGVVLIRVLGQHAIVLAEKEKDDAKEKQEPEQEQEQAPITPPLSAELKAVLEEKTQHPFQTLWQLLREDGLLVPSLIVFALFVASFTTMIEVLLFRGLLELGSGLALISERINAVALFLIFLVGTLLLEFPLAALILRLGRRLENRLRIQFLTKIPRLGDRYFHSRLTSDMTQRAYELRQLRSLPQLGVTWVRLFFQIVLTAIGIIWINPSGIGIALLGTVIAVGFSIITHPLLAEQDLVLRTHAAALSRFYLDALLGLIPIRTHSASDAVRKEHESLLVEWLRASRRFYQADTIIRVTQSFFGAGLAFWLLYDYLSKGGEPSGILLLFYWTLRLPALGQALASVTQQYPMQRNRLLRLLEPLSAPEEAELFAPQADEQVDVDANTQSEPPNQGVAINVQDVTVRAGGHTILQHITLTIPAGQHLAIVGSSGAGKSTLVGLLLGWHRPASGHILIDKTSLAGKHLLDLRRQTAWVDPSVQIWNRSLLHNINYGSTTPASGTMGNVIEQADLLEVLERLPKGLQTQLGEGGGLLSGGEGQRVRLGRAMRREGVRLVILDEPFRGLDRSKRRELLQRARDYWKDVTLIFISHDIAQTQDFERVLVIEEGQIVEDDHPAQLLAQPSSRYQALLRAEEAVRKGLWEKEEWRRLWLEDGKLREDSG